MQRLIIICTVFVALIMMTSFSSSSSFTSATITKSCVALNGIVELTGLDTTEGISITDTDKGSCSVSITHSKIASIEFPDTIYGNFTEIIIQGNTFHSIGNDNNQTALPNPAGSAFAPIVFNAFNRDSDKVARIRIIDNVWNTTGTFCNCYTFFGSTISFVIFNGDITVDAPPNDFTDLVEISNNTWDAKVSELPHKPGTPPNSQPPSDNPINFVLIFAQFGGFITQTGKNLPINFASNTFNVETTLNQSFTIQFIAFDYGFENTSLKLTNNELHWLAVDSTSTLTMTVVSFNRGVSGGSAYLANLIGNTFDMRAALAFGKEENFLNAAILFFQSSMTYNAPKSAAASQNAFDWILFKDNTVNIIAHVGSVISNLISFQDSAAISNDLVAINITGNTVRSSFLSSGQVDFGWIFSSTFTVPTNPFLPGAFGVIDISTNAWVHKVTGASYTKAYFVFLNSQVGSSVTINYLGLTSNNISTQANASAYVGQSEFFLTYILSPGSGAPATNMNSILLSGNIIEAFLLGSITAFTLFANGNQLINRVGLEVSLNIVTVNAPSSSLTASLVTDVNVFVFNGPVLFLANIFDVYRFQCYTGQTISCNESTAVGQFLSVATLSLKGQQYEFREPVSITDNLIRVQSSNILIQQESDYDFQGIQIVRNNAASFVAVKGFQLFGNAIEAKVMTPNFGTPLPDGKTLNRVPIMIMQATTHNAAADQFIFQSNKFAMDKNRIAVECAPCTVAIFGLNITDKQTESESTLKTDDFTLTNNNVSVIPPDSLNAQLFPDPDANAYFCVASQIMFCVPAPRATPFTCYNPIVVNGDDTSSPKITISNGATTINFPTSWNIGPSYPQGAQFPTNFLDVAFQMAVGFAPNNSFPTTFSNNPVMLLQANEFNWGGVVRNTDTWKGLLASTYIASVFSMGVPPLDLGSMNLNYGVLQINVCDQGTLLGASMSLLMQFIGLKYTACQTTTTVAPPITSTTPTPSGPGPATTNSPAEPTATTSSNAPSPSPSKQDIVTFRNGSTLVLDPKYFTAKFSGMQQIGIAPGSYTWFMSLITPSTFGGVCAFSAFLAQGSACGTNQFTDAPYSVAPNNDETGVQLIFKETFAATPWQATVEIICDPVRGTLFTPSNSYEASQPSTTVVVSWILSSKGACLNAQPMTTTTPSPTNSPGGNNNNNGGNKDKNGGLGGGATAGIVIVVLLIVGLGAGFAYVKRDRLREMIGGSSSSSAYRRSAQEIDSSGPNSVGYGSVTGDELESRRMSLASSAPDTGDHHRV